MYALWDALLFNIIMEELVTPTGAKSLVHLLTYTEREGGSRIHFLFVRAKITYFGFFTPYCRVDLITVAPHNRRGLTTFLITTTSFFKCLPGQEVGSRYAEAFRSYTLTICGIL